MNAGDIVKDLSGDRGVVRRIGPPSVGEGSSTDTTVMVEWSTVDGKPVRLMGSWENVSDLTLVKAAKAGAIRSGE